MKNDSSQRLRSLHQETDQRFVATTNAISTAVSSAIGCGRGCFSCCVDEITVWQPEADRIARHVQKAAITLEVGPVGGCALLRDGRCQAYEARPYVCRSQGAVLQFWDEDGPRRDTCPEHLQDVDLVGLPAAAVFKLGPAEQELASIASQELGERAGRGLPDRVSLRALTIALAAGAHSGK